MKILSNSTNYALRALIYLLNRQEDEGHVSIGQISEDLDISFHFLTKTFQQLTKAGILISYKGPNGGISFLRKPIDIKMVEIIKILEGENFFESCLLGLPGCGHDEPCPTHDMWSGFRGDLEKKFNDTSLAELVKMKGRITV